MAPHGYIPLIKQRLYASERPSFLEVGVDRGVTFLSVATFLARTKPQFVAVGVDVLVQEATQLLLNNLDLQQGQQAYLVNGNSLSVLPQMVEQKMKFDVIVLDGDHNYHTVSNELRHVAALLGDNGTIIIDDYDGRWSERDLWYAERLGYENVIDTTKKVETEKHGVRPAVDEWLSENPSWRLSKPIQGEPVVLSRLA